MFPWSVTARKMTGNWTHISRQRPHNAIHDAEAFFWVLTYLCLTRRGPGGRRRDELIPGRPHHPYLAFIISAYRCFFGNDNILNMAKNKSQLFLHNEYEQYVLPYIHPYFSPLQGLLLKWWKILQLAHRYPTFEAVHDAFLGALEQTILELKERPLASASDPQAKEATSVVDEFRRKDLALLRSFPHVTKEYENEVTFWPQGSKLSPSRDIQSKSSEYRDPLRMPPSSPTPQPSAAKRPKALNVSTGNK